MQYIVLTAKHHEGFAMYDSKVSDYNVVKATPYGKDILKELQLACEKYGVRMGFYYSQAQDWDDPDGYMAHKDNSNKNFQKYLDEKCKPQVKELLENYGKISLIWFDTPMGITIDQTQELIDLVKSIQPDCLLSGRTGNHMGDYMTTGDNFIPRLPYEDPWEIPATVNDTWGYNKFDTNWKSADHIISLLLKIISRGGNYLLNVGPTADGVVPEKCVEVLNEVGKYVTENSEAIYGTKTVGVAVSDALMITAQPLETIERKSANKLRQTLARIESIIEEYQAERIVLGYPKNMNNTIGERAEATEQFKEDLERRTGLEVILWDERLSTVEAERILMDTGVRRENRKQYVDKMAAAVILQNYLDSQAHEGQTE